MSTALARARAAPGRSPVSRARLLVPLATWTAVGVALVAMAGSASARADGPPDAAVALAPASEARAVEAASDGVEAKESFTFPPRGKKGIEIDPAKPATATKARGHHKIDSRANAFGAIEQAKRHGIQFETLNIVVGSGAKTAQVAIADLQITGDYLEKVLLAVADAFPPDAPITLSFKKAQFGTGHELKEFADRFSLDLQPGEVSQ